MRRVGALMVIVAGAAIYLPASAGATGATYNVLKCHERSTAVTEAVSNAGGSYATRNRCSSPEQRLEIENTGFAGAGQSGSWRFTAPSGTSIIAVHVRANLRRDNKHQAKLVVLDDTGAGTALARGGDTGEGFQNYSFSSLNHRTFMIELICEQASGCNASDVAHAYAQNIELVLADRVDPRITLAFGSLLEAGWVRGARDVQAHAADNGSGMLRITAAVNSAIVGVSPGDCSGAVRGPYASIFVPCPAAPGTLRLGRAVETATPPFANGANDLRLCAEDFAGNSPACMRRIIYVDNAPPTLAFRELDSSDPELIRVHVSEAHSGLARGQISVRPVGTTEWQRVPTDLSAEQIESRIDSGSYPPGRYELRAEAADVAGNESETMNRIDGSPMVVDFPLRAPVGLQAGLGPGRADRLTIRYGRDARASGRLVDGEGTGISDAEVVVVEGFGPGALIERRVRTVVTDEHGRWEAALPAGPSRTVTASFEGSRQFQAAQAAAGSLEVRTRATFRPSRSRIPEGERVTFSGRIGHFGARVPAPGKLVEVQVQEGAGRWNTVGEAFHTKPSGRYRFGYRFGRFYTTDVAFRFRLKVVREQAWPYRAPVASPSKKVVVAAR